MTITLTPETASARPVARAGAPAPAARAFLARYVRTLAVLVTGTGVLLLGWSGAARLGWTAAHPWPVAATLTAGWALAVAAWLRRQGWPSAVRTATWAGPAAVLVPLARLGWLSPAGLVLWGTVGVALTVLLAMAHRPLTPAAPCPGSSAPRGRAAA